MKIFYKTHFPANKYDFLPLGIKQPPGELKCFKSSGE